MSIEYPGCLYRFQGPHPPQIQQMWRDITQPDSGFEIRASSDIEALLNSRRYQVGRFLVMSANLPSLWLRKGRTRIKRLAAQILPRWLKDALRRV